MLLVWVFTISISCFCPLGSHHEYRDIGFPDFETCERIRQENAPDAAPCHLRTP